MACHRYSRLAAALVAIVGVATAAPAAVAQTVLDEAVAPPDAAALQPAGGYLDEALTPASHASGVTSFAPGCENCDRWYIGLSGGWQERETVHEVADAQTFLEFNSGFLVNAQLGYRFDVFRIEAETSFMNNDVERAGAAGFNTPAAGNVNLRAFMANVYHDFQLLDWLWEPYVGAGIGIYQSDLNGLYPDFFAGAGPSFSTHPINATSDMPLAYQFRAGVSRPVGRRTEFLVGYRYFKGEELEFSSAPFASPAAPTFHPDGAEIHNLEVGMRVRF